MSTFKLFKKRYGRRQHSLAPNTYVDLTADGEPTILKKWTKFLYGRRFKKNFYLYKNIPEQLEIFLLNYNYIYNKFFLNKSMYKGFLKKNSIKSKIIAKKISFLKFFFFNHYHNLKTSISSIYKNYYSVFNRIYISTSLIRKNFKFFFMKSFFKKNKNIFNWFSRQATFYQLNTLLTKNLIIKKNLKVKYYYFDGHKSCYWAMRMARIANSVFCEKKTLRSIRYKTFLKKELKKSYNKILYNFNLYYFLKLYKFVISFYNVLLVIQTGCIWVNGVQKFKNYYLAFYDILQISYFPGLYFYSKILKKKSIKKVKKLKKQNYLNFLNFHKKWVIKKKNTLKHCKWARDLNFSYLANFIFDYYSFTGFLLYKNNMTATSFLEPYLRMSSIQKLYKWKFRVT